MEKPQASRASCIQVRTIHCTILIHDKDFVIICTGWVVHHLLLVLRLVVLPLILVVVVAEVLPSLVPEIVRLGDYYVFR